MRPVVVDLLNSLNLLTCNDALTNPFKTVSALDHFEEQFSLLTCVIFWKVCLKLLISSTDLGSGFLSLFLNMDFVGAHQIQLILYPNYWDSYTSLINNSLDFKVNVVLLSWNEWNWCPLTEELILENVKLLV